MAVISAARRGRKPELFILVPPLFAHSFQVVVYSSFQHGRAWNGCCDGVFLFMILGVFLRLGIELGERLQDVVCGVEECSHGPGLAGAWVRRGRFQNVFARAGVGAGDNTPSGAVPLLDHRRRGSGIGIHEIPHCPDVVGGDDGDALEQPGGWAGDDAPTGAVPLLDEGLNAGARNELPYRPDVVAGDRCCCLQGVSNRAETLGLDTTLQLVPFQCRVSVCSIPLVSENPTAQTSLAETLATPLSSLTGPPPLLRNTRHHLA